MSDLRNNLVPKNIQKLFLPLSRIHSCGSRSSTSQNFYIKKSNLEINEFIWNQIKNFMSPLPISSIHGFLGGGVDCGFKGLEALECEL